MENPCNCHKLARWMCCSRPHPVLRHDVACASKVIGMRHRLGETDHAVVAVSPRAASTVHARERPAPTQHKSNRHKLHILCNFDAPFLRKAFYKRFLSFAISHILQILQAERENTALCFIDEIKIKHAHVLLPNFRQISPPFHGVKFWYDQDYVCKRLGQCTLQGHSVS